MYVHDTLLILCIHRIKVGDKGPGSGNRPRPQDKASTILSNSFQSITRLSLRTRDREEEVGGL